MGNMNLIKDMPKKLGFGCMRLPIIGDKTENIDFDTFSKMVDTFMGQGFTYFDTAYPYHNEKSEEAVRKCLVERYPRDSFLLADKMPVWLVKTNEDYQKIFDTQLERTGATYFDFYLLHALNKERFDFLQETGGFEFGTKMKAEGKVKNLGFSFHDSAEVLDEILTAHPEVDFVQLQINYFDWNSINVQSGDCYAVAEKHNVPIIVMEPVKGGTLANLIGKPAELLQELNPEASYASYAIRFVASLPNVMMVLSGMSTMEQMLDNTSYMKDFVPLTSKEKDVIKKVTSALEEMKSIRCTSCQYCVKGCPKQIRIPSIFTVYNMSMQFGITDSIRRQYREVTGEERGKASDCIACGKCEQQCPQHLPIRELLKEVASSLEEQIHTKRKYPHTFCQKSS